MLYSKVISKSLTGPGDTRQLDLTLGGRGVISSQLFERAILGYFLGGVRVRSAMVDGGLLMLDVDLGLLTPLPFVLPFGITVMVGLWESE